MLRFCGEMPVTSCPSIRIVPEATRSSPAISLMSEVLPDPVSPSRTLNRPGSRISEVSLTWVICPTSLVMALSSSASLASPVSSDCAALFRGAFRGVPGPEGPGSGTPASVGLGPALDQLVIGDGLALRLLVVELGLRTIRLAEPFRGILRLVQARAASAVDAGGFVGLLHPGHGDVHLLGQAVHRLLRREGAGVHVADLLPPDLGELRVVGHVDAGGRPAHAVGRAVELHEATEFRRPFGEAFMPHGRVADEGQTDVALLHVD